MHNYFRLIDFLCLCFLFKQNHLNATKTFKGCYDCELNKNFNEGFSFFYI